MAAPAGARAGAGDGGGLSFSSARSPPPLLTATVATAGAAGPGHVRSDPVLGRPDLDSRWPVRLRGRRRAVPAVVVKTEAAAAAWGAGFGAWCPDPAVPGQGAAPEMVGHTPCGGWRRGRLRHRRVPGATKMVSDGLVVRHWDASGGARSGYAWPGRRG